MIILEKFIHYCEHNTIPIPIVMSDELCYVNNMISQYHTTQYVSI